MSKIKSIQIAKKRAKHFAINICNYSWLLNDSLLEKDILSCIIFIYKMSEKINSHIDNNYVENDLATKYWLSQYLKYCDKIVNFDYIRE